MYVGNPVLRTTAGGQIVGRYWEAQIPASGRLTTHHLTKINPVNFTRSG